MASQPAMNSLFLLLEIFLFHLHYWKIVFLAMILGWHHSPWPSLFLIKSQLLFLVHNESFFFCCFQHFLSFNNLTIMCLGVHLFAFILPGVFYISWMCRLMFFIKFWKFSAIASLNIFCTFLCVLSFWHLYYAHLSGLDGLPCFSEAL